MKNLILASVFVLLAFSSCKSEEMTRHCSHSKTGQELALKRPPGPNYGNVVLILSGDPSQVMSRCTGTIVGPNVVLTAASCHEGDVNSVFVVSKSIGILYESDPDLQSKLLDKALRPKKIIVKETASSTSSSVDSEKYADDLAFLIFDNDTFISQSSRAKFFVISSLYEPDSRPKNRDPIKTVGFGDESATRLDVTSKNGVYLRDEALLKDLVFTFDVEYLPEAGGETRYGKTFMGDKGAPMFADRGQNPFLKNLVGILTHIEAPKSITPPVSGQASSLEQQRSLYVDLYSERSLALLKKARDEGAQFLRPDELKPALPMGPLLGPGECPK